MLIIQGMSSKYNIDMRVVYPDGCLQTESSPPVL